MSKLPVFFKGLTPELVKKAELELNETPHIKAKALTEFRKLISEQKDINCRPDDVFLLRFLRMKKFNVHKALKVLRNYYIHKYRNSGVIIGLKPSYVKRLIEMNVIFYSPYRLPDGSHVVLLKIGNYNSRISTAEEALAVIFICMELALECEASQISGVNTIIDFTHAGMQQYKQFLNYNILKFLCSSLQECWPERLKGIHYRNEPYLVKTLVKVAKAIVSKKLMDRVHFHGDNLHSLHSHIPKEYLPEDLGGTLRSEDYKHFASYFFSQESFIEEINQYGIIEKKK